MTLDVELQIVSMAYVRAIEKDKAFESSSLKADYSQVLSDLALAIASASTMNKVMNSELGKRWKIISTLICKFASNSNTLDWKTFAEENSATLQSY